jgi:hypothetical protein
MSWITDNTFEFRPLSREAEGLLRYNGGKWTPDDGEWDIAFASGKGYRGYPYGIYLNVPNYKNLVWSYVYHRAWGDTIEEHPGRNAWHYMTTDEKPFEGYWDKSKHPNEIVSGLSMTKCSSPHRCANGTGPEFQINDPYIASGLVRVQGTEEIVKFPEIFKCCYCGDIDWREAEAMSANELYKVRRIKNLKAELAKLEGT